MDITMYIARIDQQGCFARYLAVFSLRFEHHVFLFYRLLFQPKTLSRPKKCSVRKFTKKYIYLLWVFKKAYIFSVIFNRLLKLVDIIV